MTPEEKAREHFDQWESELDFLNWGSKPVPAALPWWQSVLGAVAFVFCTVVVPWAFVGLILWVLYRLVGLFL